MNFDLIIIGGGILGTFHAYHALNKGLKVALLEKDAKPKGATVRNFGQIVPSGMDAKWQAYGRRSLEIYKEIQDQFDISVRQQGTIYLASDEEELQLLEELAEINRKNEYSSELWEAKRCLTNYPGLKASYCKGGLFFEEEITVEPRVAIHRILEFLQETKGLKYFPKTPVLGIQPMSDTVQVHTAGDRDFQSEKVILCNGSEFQLLFPDLFARSNLQRVKLQMMCTKPQTGIRIPGSILTGLSIRRYESFRECPSYAEIKERENPDSYAKKWGVHILFKQAIDGSVIIGDSHEYADADQGHLLDHELREPLNQFMLQEAQKIFDLPTWQLYSSWQGVYTQCKDSDIFLHEMEEKVYIVTGIGGKGMTASAGFAEEHINRLF